MDSIDRRDEAASAVQEDARARAIELGDALTVRDIEIAHTAISEKLRQVQGIDMTNTGNAARDADWKHYIKGHEDARDRFARILAEERGE